MKIEHILDGSDNRRRIVVDGATIGWITKWYETDKVNQTGIKRFAAKPLGACPARVNCDSMSSAEAYLLNVWRG